MLVALAGSQLPDLEKIEAMVQRYREQLLANEYRRLMAHDNAKGITPAQIEKYYRSHKQQFTLQRPLVKGIYLKIEQSAPNIDELRTWLKTADSKDIDSLENYGLADAMEYDYFAGTWVDWQAIADHIPYRFDDPDTFVASNTFFEWSANGSIFMLRILDYLKSGNIKPQEFAAAEIRELLIEQSRNDYDRRILSDLYSQGIKSNTIKPGAYTPRKYR